MNFQTHSANYLKRFSLREKKSTQSKTTHQKHIPINSHKSWTLRNFRSGIFFSSHCSFTMIIFRVGRNFQLNFFAKNLLQFMRIKIFVWSLIVSCIFQCCLTIFNSFFIAFVSLVLSFVSRSRLPLFGRNIVLSFTTIFILLCDNNLLY